MLWSFGWQLLLFESESSPAGSRVQRKLGCFLAVLSWEVVEPLEDEAWLLAEAGHCTLRVTAWPSL